MSTATREELLMSLSRLLGDVEAMSAAGDRKEVWVTNAGTRARIAEARDILCREEIENLAGAGYAVRYCPACGSIGPVPSGAVSCCPDGNEAVEIPHNVAVQAAEGFKARIAAMEVAG